MAVKYRDGWGFYALNGVCVPDWLVTTTDSDLAPERMLEIDNAEVRKEFIRKVGLERCWHKLAKVVDRMGDYELGIISGPNLNPSRVCLKMKNPSVPDVWHVEYVPPNIKTAREALTWRNGTKIEPKVLT